MIKMYFTQVNRNVEYIKLDIYFTNIQMLSLNSISIVFQIPEKKKLLEAR